MVQYDHFFDFVEMWMQQTFCARAVFERKINAFLSNNYEKKKNFCEQTRAILLTEKWMTVNKLKKKVKKVLL